MSASVAHEIAARGQGNQGKPCLANGLSATFQAIDQGHDAHHPHPGFTEDLHCLKARTSGGDHVFEQCDAHSWLEREIPLDPFRGSVILTGLTNVQGWQGTPLEKAHQRDGAGQRAAAELDSGDGAALLELREGLEHELPSESMAFRSEDGLFAIDEEIALTSRGQHHALALEASLAQ